MLDELLGRSALKDRIEELEADLDRLEAQYAAESERRADAITEKQAAEEEVNRLEDRIAQLEGELERTQTDSRTTTVRRQERLGPTEVQGVLERLKSYQTDEEGALTALVETDLPVGSESLLGESGTFVLEHAPCLLCLDDDGLISVVLDPPILPAEGTGWDDRFHLEADWFRPSGRHALVLARSDLCAIGLYDGRELRSVQGFESDVHGAHSKGGFSQDRFERRRTEQIEDHLDRTRETVESVAGDVNNRYLVGDRRAIDALTPDIDPTATAPVDATGSPREALMDAAQSFWTTDLYVI